MRTYLTGTPGSVQHLQDSQPDYTGLRAQLVTCRADSPVPPAPLTLGQRSELLGRALTSLDTTTGLMYCVDCLADLPADHTFTEHVCA